MSIQQVV